MGSRKYQRLLILAVGLGLSGFAGQFCTRVGYAQVISGDVVGVVKDVSGAQIPNAQISARNISTGISYAATANSQGEYRISNLPAGKYNLEATAQGFAGAKVENLDVQLNQTITADITLKVTSSTTIEVTSEAAVSIDTTNSQLQTTFDTKEVQDLPTATIGLGVCRFGMALWDF